jgi:hypothetical protein
MACPVPLLEENHANRTSDILRGVDDRAVGRGGARRREEPRRRQAGDHVARQQLAYNDNDDIARQLPRVGAYDEDVDDARQPACFGTNDHVDARLVLEPRQQAPDDHDDARVVVEIG